ncbi:MAG: AMP-binding protein [Solirubrobacterales bacterium]|nr:AMP-binding protein [Solirubrobacterales bacterium]
MAASKAPDRLAIEAPERSLTYSELLQAAIGAAGALERLGVRAGDRVALALPPGPDFLVALHGCLLAGAAGVPIDLRLTESERAQRMAGAGIVVSEPLEPQPVAWPTSALDADPDVAVMHTSGTTAAPKPVTLSYGNFLASALGSAVALGLEPNERWLCPMPLTHVGGLSIPIRSAIYATTAVVHGRFDTEAVLSELMDPGRRITLVSLVPTMLARLLDTGLERPPTLRWALLGGGPIAPALVARAEAAGVPVAPTYGMTEACSQIATFGWPLPGVDYYTSSGELLVRGPIVSAGATDERGWLQTGDLAEFDERGRLVITGRKADTIVTGGENVAPAEVEAVLLEHPSVADAAVHPRAHPEWGEAVVATVVLRDGGVAAPAELRAHCAARLASFKVPKAIEFADVLPRTGSGKLLRRKL